MCGIAGAIHLSGQSIPCLPRRLETMNYLQKHRGPDGEGIWEHPSKSVGLGHCRLSIIDIDTTISMLMLILTMILFYYYYYYVASS